MRHLGVCLNVEFFRVYSTITVNILIHENNDLLKKSSSLFYYASYFNSNIFIEFTQVLYFNFLIQDKFLCNPLASYLILALPRRGRSTTLFRKIGFFSNPTEKFIEISGVNWRRAGRAVAPPPPPEFFCPLPPRKWSDF